ncbi:MAG: hypothetical protein QW153_00880 [Candidatus Bilamarchaeaceae archaeon]
MKKTLLFLILFFSLAAGQSVLDIATDWARTVEALLIGLVMLALVVSATAYILAGFFGAETRAKIQDWAQTLIAASFVSTMVLILLYALLPNWVTGGAPTLTLDKMIVEVARLARDSLLNLIILLTITAALVYIVGQLFGAETRAKATDWSQTIIIATIMASVLYIILFEVIAKFALQIPIPITDFYKQILALIIVMIGCIVLITYLASKVLKVPEWEAYLTVELSNLTSAILIIIFIFGFFSVSTEFANNLMKNSGISGLEKAPSVPAGAALILEKIIKDTEIARTDCYTIQACTSVLNTFYKRTGESVLNTVYKIYPGIDTFATLSGILANSLIMLEGSLKAQLLLLLIIDALVVPLLLPAGAVLRFFPPTKDAGAFLLAIVIGLQVIYPLTYIINAIVFNEIGITYREPIELIAHVCGLNFFSMSIPAILIPKIASVFSSSLAQTLSIGLQPLTFEGTIMLIMIGQYMTILDYIATISLFGFFAPAVSMVITVAFINALIKFIVRRD